MQTRTKEEAIKGAFFAALVGDALCLGDFKGFSAIPKEWLDTLDDYEHCNTLLSKLPLLKDS